MNEIGIESPRKGCVCREATRGREQDTRHQSDGVTLDWEPAGTPGMEKGDVK